MVELQFTHVAITNPGSLALHFHHLPDRSGIYWLTFDDGSEYIGQAVEMVRRVATHRRTQAGTITGLAFAPVPREDLDVAERWFIASREAADASLRNKLLTRTPGGPGPGSFEVSEGVSVALPWDRAQRGRAEPLPGSCLDSAATAAAGHAGKWDRLQAHPSWPRVRLFLRHFVAETLSSPHLTAGALWTVSALPNTARRPGWYRLCTLNVGRIEAVYIGHDEHEGTVVCWNLEPLEKYTDLPAHVRALAGRRWPSQKTRSAVEVGMHAGYSEPVCTLRIRGADLADQVLAGRGMADLAYRFNTRYQRQGMTFQRRGHNPLFAADLLTRD